MIIVTTWRAIFRAIFFSSSSKHLWNQLHHNYSHFSFYLNRKYANYLFYYTILDRKCHKQCVRHQIPLDENTNALCVIQITLIFVNKSGVDKFICSKHMSECYELCIIFLMNIFVSKLPNYHACTSVYRLNKFWIEKKKTIKKFATLFIYKL